MIQCEKRRSEFHNGDPRFRCLNQQSSYPLQVVDDQQCAACPVRIGPPAPRPTPELIVLRPDGYPPCAYRSGSGCSVTGLPVTQEICGGCVKEAVTEEAGLGEKMANYFNAIRKWVAAGRPTRTDAEVKNLYENHCKSCRLNSGTGCKKCGCAVKEDGFPFDNKLKMATERCPLGRW